MGEGGSEGIGTEVSLTTERGQGEGGGRGGRN